MWFADILQNKQGNIQETQQNIPSSQNYSIIQKAPQSIPIDWDQPQIPTNIRRCQIDAAPSKTQIHQIPIENPQNQYQIPSIEISNRQTINIPSQNNQTPVNNYELPSQGVSLPPEEDEELKRIREMILDTQNDIKKMNLNVNLFE